MTPEAAAARLEAVLRQENAALAACDAVAASAFLEEKLEAARGLTAGVSPAAAERLRDLAAENRRLLERAIRIQSRIVAMVAKAARQSPAVSRYGAKGRTVADKGPLALRQQA